MTDPLRPTTSLTQSGDLVQLITERERRFIFSLEPGNTFQSHLGIIHHDDLIGVSWGSRIKTHMGKVFAVLQPQLDDLLRDIPRKTQIMYPKDIGYILVTMGIGPGCRVLEAGTGSGAFTTALAYMVGNEGHIYTYEKRQNFSEAAEKTLKKYKLDHRVTFKCRDIAEGVDEENLHAIFLDLPDPENYISVVRGALSPGGFLGCFLPTTNQVSTLITTLKQNNFEYIEVSEMLHRYYKPTATRLRPVDQMVAHTGFLIFTRKLAAFSEIHEPDYADPDEE